MNEDRSNPKAHVYTEHGGWVVYQDHETILAELQAGGVITLHATTYEGHDHEVTVRCSAVYAVSELTEERWLFELQAFMDSRAARDAQTQMALQQAAMAGAIRNQVDP